MAPNKPLTPLEMNALVRELGKRSDASLAKEIGMSREYVQKLRVSKNIPAHNSGPPLSTPWPIRFTRKAAAMIRRAMKVTGHTNRSKYVRDAVREKNEAVLKGGK